MARVRLVGAETGDLSELVVAGSNTSADSAVINGGGGYSFKLAGAAGDSFYGVGFSLPRTFTKCYFRFDVLTTPATQLTVSHTFRDSANALQGVVNFTFHTDGTFFFTIFN